MPTIAQVTPFAWEEPQEVNRHVRALSGALAARGHQVLIVAPSRDTELVKDSRARIRLGDFGDRSQPRLLAVGELLPTLQPRRTVPALPVDISRSVDELLDRQGIDIVHVHEPWAPSVASTALRHSRSLNVATFHQPAERPLSTQVGRRFVETFFGRLDARIAAFESVARRLDAAFPAQYEVIRPDVPVFERGPHSGPLRILICAQEGRTALRHALRALRRIPEHADWVATVYAPGTPVPATLARGRLRERVTVLSDAQPPGAPGLDALLREADVLVAASAGVTPAPGLVLRALGAGAVPAVTDLAAYTELVGDGALGPVHRTADVDTLGAQLGALATDRASLDRYRAAAEPLRASIGTGTAAIEAVYARLLARRHDPAPRPEIRRALADRPFIDVDLHMHTDHSFDCATPVEVLLAAARDKGLGAIAVTDHNEISGALEAAEKAADFGVKVIVGEEVKTASQGEVIGLFLREKIPKGVTLQEAIADIKRQGGLVYVPHPFDRLHSIPDYEHLLAVLDDIDALEVFNPRVALPAFNEEAVRFARKYAVVGGAGSDSHVAQGLGNVRIRMRDFDGPEEFLESLREADIAGRPSSLYYVGVQALKFLQTKALPAPAREAARERAVRRATRNR